MCGYRQPSTPTKKGEESHYQHSPSHLGITSAIAPPAPSSISALLCNSLRILTTEQLATTKELKTLSTNEVKMISLSISVPCVVKKPKQTAIKQSVHITTTDLTGRNFTPLQTMIRSDMMTDVCSC